MNSATWKRLKGEIGFKPKEEMRQIMDDGGIYIPYVIQDTQGNCVYTVLGDTKSNRLYMSMINGDDVFVGAINSDTDEEMLEKTPRMHPDDAGLCVFLGDMLCCLAEGCTKKQVLDSWDEEFLGS
jgi:hypothetical protein